MALKDTFLKTLLGMKELDNWKTKIKSFSLFKNIKHYD